MKDQLECLGLPNPAQICYLNSSLQSLLTLEDFCKKTSSTREQVWSLVPEVMILRWWLRAPELGTSNRKMPTSSLTSVPEQMRYWGLQLQVLAQAWVTYRCPMEEQPGSESMLVLCCLQEQSELECQMQPYAQHQASAFIHHPAKPRTRRRRPKDTGPRRSGRTIHQTRHDEG
ncbi:ubiquitin carboxyl-terminal hydrolase 37-like protein [Lates japonicus]|uniref:Ubiquitin carboxyl-terminal hydrolase 37-like protein n=1 Tax=Lates japonicus TaxID=270547 RepID=A0AAD3MIW7_LATJO|nr:ubiquitin carboxyl-terminal hydrolase 37-like protein [Lates japonicus]